MRIQADYPTRFGTDQHRISSDGRSGGQIQVRLSGKPLSASAEERMKMIRRNGVLLIAAALLSVGVGLWLGKSKSSPSTALPPTTDGNEATPKVEPRASAVRGRGSYNGPP